MNNPTLSFMSENKHTQNAPKNSKSSAQQSEVINTSPYAYFEKKWNIDEDGLAHLNLNGKKDSESITILTRLLRESAEDIIETYWDASGHKRYRHHETYFLDGVVVDGKTFWFGSPEEHFSNLMLITRDNESGQSLWSKTIDLSKHVEYAYYVGLVDYSNLAIELWETIKNDNGK